MNEPRCLSCNNPSIELAFHYGRPGSWRTHPLDDDRWATCTTCAQVYHNTFRSCMSEDEYLGRIRTVDLNDRIKEIEVQLTLKHSQADTIPRLQKVLELLKQAREDWKAPGCQAKALRAEEMANAILRREVDP